MHKNAPLPDKDEKKFWGGAQPPPQTPAPLENGIPSSQSPSPRHLRRLASRAFGAPRSRSLWFTTRTLYVGYYASKSLKMYTAQAISVDGQDRITVIPRVLVEFPLMNTASLTVGQTALSISEGQTQSIDIHRVDIEITILTKIYRLLLTEMSKIMEQDAVCKI